MFSTCKVRTFNCHFPKLAIAVVVVYFFFCLYLCPFLKHYSSFHIIPLAVLFLSLMLFFFFLFLFSIIPSLERVSKSICKYKFMCVQLPLRSYFDLQHRNEYKTNDSQSADK